MTENTAIKQLEIEGPFKQLPEKEVIPKFKMSGYYLNQKVRGYVAGEKEALNLLNKGDIKQLSLFDNISEPTKSLINKICLEQPHYKIVKDIKLSPPEDRLMNVLLNYLSDEVIEPYFEAGVITSPVNTEGLPREQWGDKELIPIALEISLNKLYKDYNNNPRYSGKVMSNMMIVLYRLLNKRYRIAFTTKWTDETGAERENRIERLPPLIEILPIYLGLTPEEAKILDSGNSQDSMEVFRKRGSIIIKFCPIFIDSIKRNYLEYPKRINEMTALASGGVKRVTESIIILRDYLRRQIKINKDKKLGDLHAISKEEIIKKLGLEIYSNKNRLSDLKKALEKSYNACMNKNLNLITNVKERRGVRGQRMVVFTLNLEWLN